MLLDIPEADRPSRDAAGSERDSRAAGLAAAAVAAAVAAGTADSEGGAEEETLVAAVADVAPGDAVAEPPAVAPEPTVGLPAARIRSGAYLPANGRPPHVVQSADAAGPASVRLYVHPGRVVLGEMSAARVADQLDMARAVLFDSLGAAELAADEGAGFLVEVCEAFLDDEGVRRESGCYFLGRLR